MSILLEAVILYWFLEKLQIAMNKMIFAPCNMQSYLTERIGEGNALPNQALTKDTSAHREPS